jgi:hypothetical protein
LGQSDNDGTLDVVARSGSALFIYDPATLSLVRTTIGDKAAYLVGGNTALELLDVGGDHVPTIHPINQTLHWRSSVDITLAASDSDGDALSFEITDLPSSMVIPQLVVAEDSKR